MAAKKKTKSAAKPSKPVKTADKAKMEITEIPGEVRIERSPFNLKGKLKYLSTDIDTLHSYVQEKKSVKLSEVVAKFKVDKKTAEDWGSILEDHKMIDMHYPVAGEPMLRVHVPKGEKRKKKDDAKDDKKKSGKEESVKEKHKSRRSRFTKKRIMIMAEIIGLGELLIYIFIVNQYLRDNFIPTLNYQLRNLPANIANIPSYVQSRDFAINPLYIAIGILIVVFWVVLVISRKRKGHKKNTKKGTPKKAQASKPDKDNSNKNKPDQEKKDKKDSEPPKPANQETPTKIAIKSG